MPNINEKFPERVGKITSSKIAVVLGGWKAPTYYAESNKEKAGQLKTPGKWTDGAKTYARQLAMERLGFEFEEITTFAMEWGKDWESVNRAKTAEDLKMTISDEVFISYNDYMGSTPDGIIDEIYIFESKCLQLPAHLKAIETPFPEHVIQVQHQLLCSKKERGILSYFYSYRKRGRKYAGSSQKTVYN